MVMYGEFKKSFMPYLKLVSEAERYHGKQKLVYVLVEIGRDSKPNIMCCR
jgi:hypothetical protein